jgi:hypothetical protein
VVAAVLAKHMEALDLQFPKVDADEMQAIEAAHKKLLAQKK